jgi:cystathionine beta-lyase
MSYDFDELIDRRGTWSIKHDFAAERGKPEDLLPLWVADMDFKTPPAVTEALLKAVSHGIYGYSESKQEYFEAVSHWYRERFGWMVQREWLVKTPGVVYAIACAVRALTKEGDAVLIQQPVYYPFSETIRVNKRKLIDNPLVYENGAYRMDLEDFEAKIILHKVKLFILCSPHNPIGRVWTKEELLKLGDICVKHGVFVVSDEIHSDFTYPGYQHSVFADLKEEFLHRTITCTAPSKTFNLAGLQVSNIFIEDSSIRRRFREEITASGYSQLNTMGLIACRAAYEQGGPWLEELKTYLSGNLQLIREYLKEKLPQVKLIEPEGTYLVWLDFSDLGLGENELEKLIVGHAKLWLDAGTMFGEEGRGFQRMNIACPREIIKKALIQLENAVNAL